MTVSTPTTADYAASYVRQFGFGIVPLPPRSKRPTSEDWGHNIITDPEQAHRYYTERPDWNIGAALGPSRLCSLDIDDPDAVQIICDEFGWDFDALVTGHPTVQGAPGRFRVMFRMPDGLALPYHSLTWPDRENPKRRVTVFEIRAAVDGQQRQDVLPPSIHPDTGEPYQWITRPSAATGIPIPPNWLIALWQNWDALKPQLQQACPWGKPAELPKRTKSRHAAPDQGDSVIDAYNAAHGILDALTAYGYRKQGRRWLSPHSSTKLPGVNVFEHDNRCWIHHASDPLCSTETGQPVAPFDLFCHYDHGGDVRAACRAAADERGMQRKPTPTATRSKPAPRPVSVDPDTGEILEAPVEHPARQPLDVFAEFPAPPLEADMLPSVLWRYAAECGELIGVDPAMIAIPALVSCAAALHDDIKIQPKRHETGWTESARLWCAIVGPPSVKKSPAIRRATKRLRKIDADLADENAKLAADYADQMEQFKDVKKEAKKTGAPIDPPSKPQMKRMIVEDITVEALSEVLKDNDRGVLCIQDELSGWFGSMDAYTGGKAGNKDRAAWLQAYNGGFRQVDRVMRGSVHIPNFSVSMIGGIQPDAIRRIAKDMTDDGLMQRFMVVIGRNAPEFDRREDDHVGRNFAALVDHLHRIQPGGDVITLSEDAHQVREQIVAYAAELSDYPALPGGLRSHLGKWSGLFARLLLTYHAIDCAVARVHPNERKVSGACARQVDAIMRRFLLPHALAYYTDILGASSDLEHARWVAGYILSKKLDSISNREIVQAYKQWRALDDWRRQRVMQVLEDMGWIVPDQDDTRRRVATHWLVNSQVHEMFVQKATDEAQRRGRIKAEIAAMSRRPTT